jgi:hypothetical protein
MIAPPGRRMEGITEVINRYTQETHIPINALFATDSETGQVTSVTMVRDIRAKKEENPLNERYDQVAQNIAGTAGMLLLSADQNPLLSGDAYNVIGLYPGYDPQDLSLDDTRKSAMVVLARHGEAHGIGWKTHRHQLYATWMVPPKLAPDADARPAAASPQPTLAFYNEQVLTVVGERRRAGVRLDTLIGIFHDVAAERGQLRYLGAVTAAGRLALPSEQAQRRVFSYGN